MTYDKRCVGLDDQEVSQSWVFQLATCERCTFSSGAVGILRVDSCKKIRRCDGRVGGKYVTFSPAKLNDQHIVKQKVQPSYR